MNKAVKRNSCRLDTYYLWLSSLNVIFEGLRTTKIGQGGGRNILACEREAHAKITSSTERFFPLLGMNFAPLWAYFSIFSLYIVRMAKSSGGGTSPPPEKLSRGNFPPRSTPIDV